MKRPRKLDHLTPILSGWAYLKRHGITAEELEEAWRRSGSTDGYALAKQLDEDTCCSPDAQMVSDLDELHYFIDAELERLVAAWWPTAGITPRLRAGDEMPKHMHSKHCCRNGITVIKVDMKLGRYHIGEEGKRYSIEAVEDVDAHLDEPVEGS